MYVCVCVFTTRLFICKRSARVSNDFICHWFQFVSETFGQCASVKRNEIKIDNWRKSDVIAGSSLLDPHGMLLGIF